MIALSPPPPKRGPESFLISVRLIGTKSNRDAYGARIAAHGSYYFVRSANGFNSQNSQWLTIPLKTVEPTITIKWPSGYECVAFFAPEHREQRTLVVEDELSCEVTFFSHRAQGRTFPSGDKQIQLV